MNEPEMLDGAGPSEAEKEMLDVALAEYESDSNRGGPWREVLEELSALEKD